MKKRFFFAENCPCIVFFRDHTRKFTADSWEKFKSIYESDHNLSEEWNFPRIKLSEQHYS